jgi:uroporphyrinogen decarboxylase
MSITNQAFANSLARTPQNVPPVWMMRQAGRYHKHYQKLKEKYTFMQLCKQPELAAQVALGPIQEFDFDVSIFFSDLLFPLEAMGMGLEYNPGPILGWQLSPSTINLLKPVSEAIEGLRFQEMALKATREVLPKNKSLIGFVGGPWTLYTYATEGGHAGSLNVAKSYSLEFYSKFMETLVPLLKQNIELQLKGGAEIVMIFDTAAGELDPMYFERMCVPHLLEIARAFPGKIGYYSKGTQADHLAPLKLASQKDKNIIWAGFGVDHRWNLKRTLTEHKAGFLQGNFDQALLFQSTTDFKKTLDQFLKPLKDLTSEERAGWVCGLGHGVLPKTPEENVKYFVERVREYFA